MPNHLDFYVGEKVTYSTDYKQEHGIIKTIDNKGYAFVVYSCGGDWDNYKDYTSAKTDTGQLVHGWV